VSSTPFGPAPRDYRLSARQSQFNWLSKTPSSIGEISTRLEANLFPIDGSTRITWNQAYLQVGEWVTFGKTYSTFMDDAAIPTTLDYNGPSGVTFVRQALLRGSLPVGERWKIEASAEDSQADFTASAAILDLRTSAKRPDLAARVRYESDSAHFQFSGCRAACASPQPRRSARAIAASTARDCPYRARCRVRRGLHQVPAGGRRGNRALFQ
jgi:hypothetical protein